MPAHTNGTWANSVFFQDSDAPADQDTLVPRPNYWAALLWRRLMGAAVLDTGPSRPDLHLYAQCQRDHSGGVTLLAINLSRTKAKTVDLPIPAERYTLTASKIEGADVQLNGQELKTSAEDTFPALEGDRRRGERALSLMGQDHGCEHVFQADHLRGPDR